MPAYPTREPPEGERISLSGLTREEAREFNKLFIASFAIFTFIALCAHLAVYFGWRPWLVGPPPGQVSLLDHVQPLLSLIG